MLTKLIAGGLAMALLVTWSLPPPSPASAIDLTGAKAIEILWQDLPGPLAPKVICIKGIREPEEFKRFLQFLVVTKEERRDPPISGDSNKIWINIVLADGKVWRATFFTPETLTLNYRGVWHLKDDRLYKLVVYTIWRQRGIDFDPFKKKE